METYKMDKATIDVSFEYIPENYDGYYPYIVVRIKKSQLTPNLESQITEILHKLQVALEA